MITQLKSPTGHDILDQYGSPFYQESSLVKPDDMGTGLVHDDNPEELGPRFRDEFPKEVVDPSDWKGLIDVGGGDMRKWVKWILNQRSVGSCAAEGVVNCHTTQRHRRGWKEIKFNPYCTYKFSGGGRDNGSSLQANIREGKSRGFVPMDLWPREGRDAHPWHEVPTPSSPIWAEAKKHRLLEVYGIGNIVEAASALFRGHSVYAAYPGHAWQLIAVLNSSQFAWVNSWGSSWDGDGIGVISGSRITFDYGLYSIATVTRGDG